MRGVRMVGGGCRGRMGCGRGQRGVEEQNMKMVGVQLCASCVK